MTEARFMKGIKYIDHLFMKHHYDLEVYLKALKILHEDEEVTSLIFDDDKPIGYIVNGIWKVFNNKIELIIC